MARIQSIGFQVEQILKEVYGIGQSKRERRQESGIRSVENGHQVSDLIHAYKTLSNSRNDLTNLGKFAKKELGIKDMSKISINEVRAWIASKNITYETASNYLSEINKVEKRFDLTREEIKELRAELSKTLKKSEKKTRYYANLDKITVPIRSTPAFELQRDYGLRISPATHINITKQLVGNMLSYQEKSGKWSHKEISKELADKIRAEAKNGRYKMNQKTYDRDIQKAIEKTGQKWNGSHGMRHSFAQNQLAAGKTKKEVSRMLGHKREEITNVYLR